MTNDLRPRTRRTLLAVDYPGRRDEARIRDLDLEADGWDVHYLLTVPLPRHLSCSGLARELLTKVPDAGPIRAVLAYCMSAPVAQEVASVLSATGEPVPLVFFDGEPSDAAVVLRETELAVQQITGKPAQLPDAIRECLRPSRLEAEPERSMKAVADHLERLATRTFEADGCTPAEAADEAAPVVGFYLDWLSHLIASARTSRAESDAPLLHVLSQTQPHTDAWPGVGKTTLHRSTSARNDLLRQPHTRRIVTRWLATDGSTDNHEEVSP